MGNRQLGVISEPTTDIKQMIMIKLLLPDPIDRVWNNNECSVTKKDIGKEELSPL